MRKIQALLNKGRLTVMAFAFALSLGLASVGVLAHSSSVAAASCDKVNIIYCGLSGSTTLGYIQALQSSYTANKSGHVASAGGQDYTDIRDVMHWAGATTDSLSRMSTTNTKVGTLYRDGRIVVDGKKVATDTWVSARFNSGSGFVHIEGNVYARKTTTSFANSSAKVLVYMPNGKMAFAVMIDCGNAIKATPVTPPAPKPAPKPTASLVCTNLTLLPGNKESDGSVTYTLTAAASATNATITSYSFDFGSGQGSTMVTSSAATAQTTHIYAPGNYTATVTVQGSGSGGAATPTPATCSKSITVVQPAAIALACVSPLVLNKLGDADSAGNTSYTLTAHASSQNVTITQYVFNFGDNGATSTVSTNATTATSEAHSYAPGSYNDINVVVTGTGTDGKTYTSTATSCMTNLTVPTLTCTAPSGSVFPTGSDQCGTVEAAVVTTNLPKTGAGGLLGLFGISTIGAMLAHRFYLKRRTI